jgi:hypothetical protein
MSKKLFASLIGLPAGKETGKIKIMWFSLVQQRRFVETVKFIISSHILLSPKKAISITERHQNWHVSHFGGQGADELTDTINRSKASKGSKKFDVCITNKIFRISGLIIVDDINQSSVMKSIDVMQYCVS